MSRGVCLYPGSFDPVTVGHLDIIRRAAAVFDRVVIGVLVNAEKHASFSMEERAQMLRDACRGIENAEVVPFSGLTAELCRQMDIRVLVRGIRGASDLESEMRMASINSLLLPGLETVYLGAGGTYSAVSSSLVREIARLDGDISALVPEEVRERIERKLRG